MKPLSMLGVAKDFPGVRALDGVDLEVSAGEIHGVVGANGAGKSTLVKILSGFFPDYRGTVAIQGRSVRLSSPRIAREYGIGVLQQEPELAWNLTVCENIFLGNACRTTTRVGLLDRKAMHQQCRLLLDQCGAEVSGDWPAGKLGRGQVQLVQLVKVLAARPDILVLDEPATALSEGERDVLFARLGAWAMDGTAIVFISHDIDDVFKLCKRITVLRDGRKVAETATAAATPKSILQEMFGVERPREPGRRSALGPPALKLDGVSTAHVNGVALTLHEGEVLGLVGKPGMVREVLRAVYGAVPRRGGRVLCARTRNLNFKSSRRDSNGNWLPSRRSGARWSFCSPECAREHHHDGASTLCSLRHLALEAPTCACIE